MPCHTLLPHLRPDVARGPGLTGGSRVGAEAAGPGVPWGIVQFGMQLVGWQGALRGRLSVLLCGEAGQLFRVGVAQG